MPTRDEYRQMAGICLALAEQSRDARERKTLADVAAGYTALAHYVAERRDDGTKPRGGDDDNPRRRSDDARQPLASCRQDWILQEPIASMFRPGTHL